MKILIVSQYYYPEQFQINEIAPELVRRGHSVTVLCGVPNYPLGKIYAGYEDDKKRFETINGARVIRVNQKPRGNGFLSLLKNYVSFVKEANNFVDSIDEEFDVIMGYQLSPVTSMLPAIRIKSKLKIPLLLYVLDIWPESGFSHLPFKKGPINNWLHKISKRIYQSADRILVTSRPFIDYLARVNAVDIHTIAYLPQHANADMLAADLNSKRGRVCNFMYAGNMGAGQTLDVVVNAAVCLGKRDDYKIHFVGDGSKRKELEEMVKEKGLSQNVVFHGNQKRDEMPKFYKMADVLLITLRGNNEVGNTMPGKLQMYMTTGKPILGAINGASVEVIAESKCGSCVFAGDYEGLAELMKDAIENPEHYAECGENAKRYFLENFTLKTYVDKLESELKQLAKCN